eukprot:TRINITY_DN16514_c0_g1_i2.p1 TRINITY_DN16514_c0_g1~~TRINITY_DN16514_c0_g1_i2.p1  ORF type:complete len:1062 (-),score=180.77 TRINITY_DN16514_c0_g1_i2:159-3344(-)
MSACNADRDARAGVGANFPSSSSSPSASAARGFCLDASDVCLHPTLPLRSRRRGLSHVAVLRRVGRPPSVVRLMGACAFACSIQHGALAWNSAGVEPYIYTFQEFYSDAQYGPDFGYYSTGRILHVDGPADNGVFHGTSVAGRDAAGAVAAAGLDGQDAVDANDEGSSDDDLDGISSGQDWFNSYTTFPMVLSPDFGHAVCDRLVSMWESMGRPSPVVLAEFGGGTGMLARDVLRRSRNVHGDFYAALAIYIIAERSPALRAAQRHTAAEFVMSGKLRVVRSDARRASLVRPVLEEVLHPGTRTVGFVLSNELIDEFDPVRLRLMWHGKSPPSIEQTTDCRSYVEAHVIHRIDATALEALLRSDSVVLGSHAGSHVSGAFVAGHGTSNADDAPPPDPSLAATAPTMQPTTFEELKWEGHSLHCGLLATPPLRRAILAVAEDLTPHERGLCVPMLVCCLPFVLAVNQALQFNYEALLPSQVMRRRGQGRGSLELLSLYRHHLQRTNGTVPLSKERYRQIRRLAIARGSDVEMALLVGSNKRVLHNGALVGRIHTEEVFLAPSQARCVELKGWMLRNAERLAVAARLRNGVAWIFDGDAGTGRTAMHLKLVVRPGESSFTKEAASLLDEGFLLTLDYGADADALTWQALVRPNYEGIHIVDARLDLFEECTTYLACPGLQDLTTSVDFTEVAQAGEKLGGWQVKAYGPIFLLELSFFDSDVRLAGPSEHSVASLGHLLERAHGVRTEGMQAWYRKPEQDPWASFKVLVQHRGDRGANWSLGAVGAEWPLAGNPRLFRAPSACWDEDLTKPPLASLITSAAHSALAYGDESSDIAMEPVVAKAYGAPDYASPVPRRDDAGTDGLAPADASGDALRGGVAMASADGGIGHDGGDVDAFDPATANASTAAEARRGTGDDTVEWPELHAELLKQFQTVLLQSSEQLAKVLDAQHDGQQKAYADLHLALLLVDYWRLIDRESGRGPQGMLELTHRLEDVRFIAESRRLPELYDEASFNRVFNGVGEVIRKITVDAEDPMNSSSSMQPRPAYACLAERALRGPAATSVS